MSQVFDRNFPVDDIEGCACNEGYSEVVSVKYYDVSGSPVIEEYPRRNPTLNFWISLSDVPLKRQQNNCIHLSS